MDITKIRASFAERVHLVCDELGIPRGHGRNTALARMFDLTPNAARKWLTGQAYPELAHAVALCERAGVNINWFLQGTPPMRGDRVDPHTVALADAIDALPQAPREELLAFLRFQVTRHQGWFTAEQVAHYLVDIDAAQARNKATATAQPTSQGPQPPAYGEPGKHRHAA